MKNLATGVTQAITNDAAFQNSPRISGDLVLWENYDYQRANWDVYMKDLTSGIVSPLASTGATEARPAVDGETAVWESTTSGNYDVWMAKVLDTVAPVIADQIPASGSLAPCTAPLISASFNDNRVGVDIGSVRLTLDGGDVSEAAGITDTGISYQAPQLTDGVHHVELTVADKAGNLSTSEWDFSSAIPNASLSTARIWWATYDDYMSGDLSVQFHLTNTSQTPVASADVLASTATQGVLMTTETPAPFGPIQPGGGADAVFRYRVPPGIITFKTVLYVGLVDACGSAYYYPGPPPGW
jgi:beta propeller repeat protein